MNLAEQFNETGRGKLPAHLGTALEDTIDCVATPVHLGKTTQVWDAMVTHRETGRKIALFRCTQMVLYPAV